MTQARDLALLIAGMLQAVSEIETFAQVGEAAFLTDLRTQRAVERSFEILGEAANQVPGAARERFPAVPWRVVIDHRNRLIHGYASVDAARVWQTIVRDLPGLRAELAHAQLLIQGARPED